MTAAARQEAIVILEVTYEMSERRACTLIGADQSSVRYIARRSANAALRGRMSEIAQDGGGLAIAACMCSGKQKSWW